MIVIKFIIAGDWHGNPYAARNAISAAMTEKAEVIIQLGDFGIWPSFDGMEYLDSMNTDLRAVDRKVVFVGGNHEDYNQIEAWEKHNPRSSKGHVYVRSNILYIPRGCAWKWAGKTFLGLGGAISIDKQWRVPNESWWWQEAITNEQMNEAVINAAYRPNRIDYLITHDCSDRTPWKKRLKPDPDSVTNRKKIDFVLDRVKPRIQFHGHMHEWYDWQLPHGSAFDPNDEGLSTQVYGLNMECEQNSMGILNTEDDSFVQIPMKIQRNTYL